MGSSSTTSTRAISAPPAGRRRRGTARSTDADSDQRGEHQPADAVRAVQQAGHVRPGAEAADRRDGQQGHRASTTRPTTAGARAATAAHAGAANPTSITSGASTASCSSTPPASHSCEVQEVASVGWSRCRAPTQDQHDPGGAEQPAGTHHVHLDPGRPIGLEHAGPVRRDEPARVAVVDAQAARRSSAARAGCGRRRRGCRAAPCGRARDGCSDSTTNVACPAGARRGRAGRAAGPRSRSAVALQPSTQAIGSVCCAAAWPGARSRGRARARSPCTTLQRVRRASAAVATPAAAAHLLTGRSCGPPERRLEDRERAQPRDGAAGRGEDRDARTATGRPQQAAPGQAARLGRASAGRTSVGSSGGRRRRGSPAASPRRAAAARRSPPRPWRSAWRGRRRTRGTTRWCSAPRWPAGRSPPRPAPRSRPARGRCSDEPPQSRRGPGEQLRVDRPELDQQQRHRRRAGEDVQALGDPVDPDRRGSGTGPGGRVLE